MLRKPIPLTPLCFACFATVAFSLFVAPVSSLSAQSLLEKRALDHVDYDRWNTISDQRISNDGKWVLFSTRDGSAEAENTVHIRRNGATKLYSIPRANGAKFTFDSKYLVYRISPSKEKLKELRKAKAKPDQMPGSSLEVLELETGEKFSEDRIKSFLVPEENGRWLAYLNDNDPADSTVKAGKSDVVETYEVTAEGLRRPEKKLKLKKRETETPAEENEPTESESKTEKSGKTENPSSEKKPEPSAESKPEIKAEKVKKDKATGTTLVLHDLNTGLEQAYPNVVRYWFSKQGTHLAFVTSVKSKEKSDAKKSEQDPDKKSADKKQESKKPADKKSEAKQASDKNGGDKAESTEPADGTEPVDGVYLVDLKTGTSQLIASGEGDYKNLDITEDGSQIGFLTDRDDYETKTSSWSLYHWKTGQAQAIKVADESSEGIPNGWWISPVATAQFTEDGRRLFFDTAPVPEPVLKERKQAAAKAAGKKVPEEDDDPKAKLDVWHWQDPQLQPQQLLQAERERRRNYRAVYNLDKKNIVQLATEDIPNVRIDWRSTSNIVLAGSDMPYRKMLSWDVPGFQDSYLINLDTGDRETLVKKTKSNGGLSPKGKFVTWFDAEQMKWYAVSTGDNREPVEISAGINHPLQNELHDTPSLPRAYGSGGWLKDDTALLIYDRYDIWQVDPTGQTEPICITENQGRENKIRFRMLRLDRELRAVDPAEPQFLSAFDENTKASGFYRLTMAEAADQSDKEPSDKEPSGKDSEKSGETKVAESTLKRLIMLDESLGGLEKAKNTDDVILTRSTFQEFPDVWSTHLKFDKIYRISDANPQQDEYRWGTAELVHWDATDGQPLDGLLYKPEGFDPSKKYPMMVYFYERNSDTLHNYYVPAAGRSIINHSFYVSRGYLVFVPDIPYKTGEPGPSAVNAILPGVEHLVAQGFVDKDKIGMQGHSWGGYQTAYLVTQTDMFACAESGAPVSNMTSAYGGIRWSSGMSRMFQYERTQSRIGETLWSAREKYIANSPLFFADQVNTPLLILHNDEDGAVPWYQGIEMFVALRRLEKPVWLLNYNAQPHWVMKDENRRDFAIRMQQFFDHYLKDAPEPEWMAIGVPAVDKGKKFGLDLMEPEKTKSDPDPEVGEVSEPNESSSKKDS